MIINIWILAQMLGLGVVLLLSFYAIYVGLRILKGWDIHSTSEKQLRLEKETYLVSTIMQYTLGFQVLSLLLFVATADFLHNIIQGAMCAFGSLNANIYGFRTLWVKILAVFFYSSWLAINHLDSKAEDYPLVKLKYKVLVALAPLLFLDAYSEIRYFVKINPDVITSCCGTALRGISNPYGFIAATLPFKPVFIGFFAVYLATIAALLWYRRDKGKKAGYSAAVLSALSFVFSVLAMFTFLSPYMNVMLFGLPTQHRCPFEVLQAPYYIGYPLYFSLFAGAILGVLVGVAMPLRKHASLQREVERFQEKAAKYSLLGFLGFLGVSVGFIIAFYLSVGVIVYH
jgi:hypothetical protein